ncbi:MAG: type II toxin-antitoxin system RelE/ParE family toxin [Pseudomonadota bacterium]
MRRPIIKPLKLVITDTAKADLKLIRTYIAKENPQAARDFVKDLIDKLFRLAETGITGSPRDWIKPDLRCFPYRERCFYFRIIDDTLFVIRVLHGKQDVNAQDFSYKTEPDE